MKPNKVVSPSANTLPGGRVPAHGYTASGFRFLFLQRTIGNRAVGSLIAQIAHAGSNKMGLLPLITLRPPAMHWQAMAKRQGQIMRRRKRTPYTEYKRQRTRLIRELRRINRITRTALRKKRQKAFIQKILVNVLRHNPFKRIEIKRIAGNARAETEWRNPRKQNLGIKATFDESIFKDPLALIIATVIHESAHADQLKAGIKYYASPARRVSTAEGIYRRAVYYFAEADARVDTLLKFAKALPKGHKTRIMGEITTMILKADKNISRMDSAIYLQRGGRKYQRWLTGLFTGKKLKHGGRIKTIWRRDKSYLGLKNDLFPWRKLP